MNGHFLNAVNLQLVQLGIQNLTKINHQTLVDFLPQMCSKDLDQRDLESWNLSVKEDTRQIELDQESNVNVGSVDRWRPPQSKPTVRNLRQSRTLGISEFLEFQSVFKS
ncbi:hypothetical protein OGAPHI_005143 [Ogataea philodendri]|uniref:Uncharacterized protein n=1 Tax=Ogataea philodendri TaxID=1378263 RepID=A0A9P8T3F2_9ASCO|nr:uncharacterized protein OGAPHI_005143 [Ogataea philodendri]KAH3663741.1 hypothetical protein OGAPHI_005143 [Ogataea philodendri]